MQSFNFYLFKGRGLEYKVALKIYKKTSLLIESSEVRKIILEDQSANLP